MTELMLTLRREKIDIPGRRILAVSDIHGHGHYLKKLLEKVGFSTEDELIIVGDIIEKGPRSLETLRYVMELEKQPNVHVLAGNVDVWQKDLIESRELSRSELLFQVVRTARAQWGGSLFLDFCKEMGIREPKTVSETVEAKEKAAVYFKRELDFLGSRPAVLEAGNYIFVHGGLPEHWEELEGKNATPVLKYDDFLHHCGTFSEYVVAGHWPTCLYRHDITGFNPLIDCEKHVISIDGGCGLKRDGQLNCLMIPDMCAPVQEISWEYWDSFPEVTALDDQEEQETSIYIQYTDNQVERLNADLPAAMSATVSAGGDKRGEGKTGLVSVRHLSSGQTAEVPEDYLYEKSGSLRCDDFCDYRFRVRKGERFALVEENAMGYLIKRGGVSCWYGGRILEDIE